MGMEENMRILRASTLFSGLSEDALRGAAGLAKERVYTSGALIDRREAGNHIGVIASGYARVTKPGRDGSVPISLLGPGDVFGAASLMGGELPVTDIEAIKPLTALIIDEDDFLSLMEKHFELTQSYCRYLIGRIRFLTERVECLAGGTAAEKLMRFLEKNAENGRVHVSFGMDQLAAALSLGRASLYRAFDELEKSGKLSRRGRDIRLL